MPFVKNIMNVHDFKEGIDQRWTPFFNIEVNQTLIAFQDPVEVVFEAADYINAHKTYKFDRTSYQTRHKEKNHNWRRISIRDNMRLGCPLKKCTNNWST
jgi:hypothetical protein